MTDLNGDSSVVSFSNTSIAQGFHEDVTINFSSSSAEAGTVTINSDDPDEDPYTFTLSVPVQDISVWRQFAKCGDSRD